MEFCPECGGLLVSSNKENGKVLKCLRCGYEFKSDTDVNYSFTRKINHGPKDKTVILTNDEQIKTMPTTRAECPKCGNREAYYWQVQTRSADEPATTFFRCTKCAYTWREY
ncbi:MAG: transcription factor S [Candidatus Odinarchaeia archaeon]